MAAITTSRPRHHGRVRARRGTTSVEFALGLPFLAALVFGGMELCWLFHQQLAVVDATGQGSRVAAVATADQDLEGEVREAVRTSLEASFMETEPAQVKVTEEVDAFGETQAIVEVTYIYTPIFDYTPSPSHITAIGVARMENR